MKHTLSISTFALSATMFACGEVVPQNQVGAPPPDAPAPTVDAGTPDGAAPPVTPIRAVEQRNPFGNLDATNLVLDGDFEFSGRQGQMPWLSFNNEQGTLDFETGGLCASGIRCGKLLKDDVVFGWMASPKAGREIDVTLRARTLVGTPKTDGSDGTCPEPKLNVYVIDIDTQDVVERVPFERGTAAVHGFCTYHGVIRPIPYASPGLYVETEDLVAKDVVLIDDAVAKLVPAGSNRQRLPQRPVRAETKARVRVVADWIKKHRQFVPARPAEPNK